MASLDNADCATTIRNCFAHCERIHITGRTNTGETLIKLTDYDIDGKISGVVETDLSSLIQFFTHETFKNVMNKTTSVSEGTMKK